MAWFKVDDRLWAHPKIVALPLTALGLWVKAGSYCAAYETDGALDRHMIGTLGAQKRDSDRLVKAGLWSETETGYVFHDWDQYQPTKRQLEAERAATRERVAKHRNSVRNTVTPPVTNGSTNGVSTPAPTRPDPTPIYNTPTDDPEFTQFWDTYPNKKGKQAAFKKWQTITKTTPPSLLIEGAKKYREATQNQDPRYIKHPTTWLNAGSWEDDYTAVPATSQEMSWEQKRMAAIPFVTDEEDDR